MHVCCSLVSTWGQVAALHQVSPCVCARHPRYCGCVTAPPWCRAPGRLRWRFDSSLNKLIRQPSAQDGKQKRPPETLLERRLALICITPPPSSAAVPDQQGGWLALAAQEQFNLSYNPSINMHWRVAREMAKTTWRAVERTRLPRGCTKVWLTFKLALAVKKSFRRSRFQTLTVSSELVLEKINMQSEYELDQCSHILPTFRDVFVQFPL